MEAAKLKMKINYVTSSEVEIIRGINDSELVKDRKEFSANGYFRIITDNIDFEIESAEIDFNKIQEEYKKYKNDYNELIKKLGVNNLEDARNKLERLNKLNSEINNIEKNIEEIKQKSPRVYKITRNLC